MGIVPRRVKLTKKDIEEHGYTVKHPGCKAILRSTTSQGHSEECRARMEKEMSKKPQVLRAKRRADEFHAEFGKNWWPENLDFCRAIVFGLGRYSGC